MKRRDTGIVALADKRPCVLPHQGACLRQVEPIAERREKRQLVGSGFGHDGEALRYQAYLAQRDPNRPGMPATFEDFLTIFNMGRDCEGAWLTASMRRSAEG